VAADGSVVQVIESDPVRGWRVVWIGIGFAVLSLFFLIYGSAGAQSPNGGPPSWTVILSGAVGLAFFGSLTMYLLPRQKRNDPLLTIRSDGVVDRSSALGVGFIPWSELKSAFVSGTRAQYAAVLLCHPKAVLRQVGLIKRTFLRFNRRIAKADLLFPTVTMPYSSQEVVDLLKNYAQQYGGSTK
jgi:hypothetical protein